jgi:uncharacterized protein (DUF58 family)
VLEMDHKLQLLHCSQRAVQLMGWLHVAGLEGRLLTDLLDAATAELLEAVRLLQPKHFVFVCAVENAAILALPGTPPVDPLDPYRSLAATEYHDALAANVRALRARGAAALTARPDQLDRAVLGAYQRFRRERRI